MRQSTIARWCSWLIEGGWLLALVLIPSYFNLLSSRHFEPDKATTLRALVLVMLAAAVIYWLEQIGVTPNAQPPAEPRPGLWTRIRTFPMALPTMLYALVFLLATIFSITRGVSFWGSYQRLQGTYTYFAYIGLALLIVTFLRRREQLERLIMVGVLGSLPSIGYGLVQHFQIDPLPWRGDVISRVASTMGNSIFVAAYLILILPFACYLAITAFRAYRSAPKDEAGGSIFGWVIGYTLLVLAALLLAYGAICFGAVVRVAGLGYWWVYPGALLSVFALFLVPTLRPHRADRMTLALLWPGLLAVGYVLFLGLAFAVGQASGAQQVRAMDGRGGTEWWLYVITALLFVVIAYALFFTLPSTNRESRTLLLFQGIGMVIMALLICVTILFTQSRGPWLGGIAGMLVFITVLLLLAWRRDGATGNTRARLWFSLLIAEAAVVVLGGALLVAFNVSDAPVFQQLRSVPYIGRMGRLLETDEGTGLVRRLIWTGDEHAGGAVGLILSDPVRTVIGWGPESMFVAYNKFYPPSLANIEARGASPDRSHEAYLDELVTKGVLGLAAYLFVLFSVLALAVKLLRRIDDWPAQVLLSACIAGIVAHSVEGLTGIPIVATLMLLWVMIAIVTVTGMLFGQYAVAAKPEPAPAETAAPAKGQQRRQRSGTARGGQSRQPVRRQQSNPLGWLIYGIILIASLTAAWLTNIDNVYADMRFQQGQIYADTTSGDMNLILTGAEFYVDAIDMEPGQDFYYLSLGRTLMSVADLHRSQSPGDLGQPKIDADMRDILRASDVQTFLNQQSALGLMSYAEAVLKDAYDINPLNKDHSANLGRLYSFWYSRMTQDPALLQQATEWYKLSHDVAPQDVVILNEYAGSIALQGTVADDQGDTATAQAKYAEAGTLFQQSKELDPKYGDTDARMADLMRVQGDTAGAIDRYIQLLAANPHALDAQYNLIVGSILDNPEQLARFRDAYEQALAANPNDATLLGIVGRISVPMGDLLRATSAFSEQLTLEPDNLDARRNLIVVLSDTKQYTQAADQAQTMLALAEQQGDTSQSQQLQTLVQFFRQLAAGS